MAIEIKVPTVGESITEVTLVKWIKKDGEWVDRDEVIAELESEKATFEINAEQAGILKTIAVEGDTLKIGDIACSIDTEAARPEGVSTAAAPAVKEEAVKTTAAPQPKTAEAIKATPVAAAIISDKKVDPKSVTPSGSNGKIVKQDVLEAIKNPAEFPVLNYLEEMKAPKK